MANKRTQAILSFIAVSLAVTLGASSQAVAKTTTLSFAQFRSQTDVVAKPWLDDLAKEVAEKTEGRVKIKVFWSSALGKGRDQFNMVRDGIADMADFPGVWIPGKFPMCEVANLPFAAENPMNIVKAMDRLDAKGYFKAWNEVEVLNWLSTAPYDFIMRKKKPMTVAELSGLKVRAPGGVANEFVTSLGMVPVKVLPSDAYMAWETGIIDAWMHMPVAVTRYKFDELGTRAILDANVMVVGNAATIMNKEKLASLSPQDQKIVREVVHKHAAAFVAGTVKQDEISIKKVAKEGVEYYRLPDAEMQKLREAAIPIWENFIKDREAKGLPGKQLVKDFVSILKELGENPIYQP